MKMNGYGYCQGCCGICIEDSGASLSRHSLNGFILYALFARAMIYVDCDEIAVLFVVDMGLFGYLIDCVECWDCSG